VISLDSTILFNSFTTKGPTHTVFVVVYAHHVTGRNIDKRLTLFTNQTVVPVIRIVRIAKTSMRVFKFEELVAVLARVACAGCDVTNLFSKNIQRTY
jgi:hypothetical protein